MVDIIKDWCYPYTCIYIKSNLYILPKYKIFECEGVDKKYFPNCNSSGVWCVEKNGAMETWIDLNLYNNHTSTYKLFELEKAFVEIILPIYTINKRNSKIESILS